jgi:hypothetical protein
MANVKRDHEYYRALAEEARKKAEAAKGRPTLRQSFLDVAASYDKLADTLEWRFRDRESDS